MATTALVDRLRATPLLRECATVDLDRIIAGSREQHLAVGELLFDDADEPDAVWVVLDGEFVVLKLVDGIDLTLDQIGPDAFIGEISLLTRTQAGHRARALAPSRVLRIPGPIFRDVARSCSAVAETVMRTLGERMHRMIRLLQQRERMAALGTIAAGLAHELFNPASAATRAAGQAAEAVAALRPIGVAFTARVWSADAQHLLAQLTTASAVASPPGAAGSDTDAVARGDREDALAEWLSAQGVADSWELAATLSERGVSADSLCAATGGHPPQIPAEELSAVLRWVAALAGADHLLGEVRQSMTRITDLVKSVKAYSHADQTTPRVEDVHAAIENTLAMFGYKLRAANVAVERAYDRTLPPIATFGGELHQVWTNLIDNAIDAGGKNIRVRTARDGAFALIEIGDDGAGIPPAIQGRIFDPFFTTKEIGKGTGLGLDIAHRIVAHHHGSIAVVSAPGDTRFTIRLPFAAAPSPAGS
jgi:signal transduction histidine kinase